MTDLAQFPPPAGLSAPATEGQLAEFVAECAFRRESLRVVGGGTRVEPGAVQAVHDLSSAGLTGIIDYEPGELTLIVRAGTPMHEVEETAAAQGQSLAFEPMDSRRVLRAAGTPTIGGVVAMNISGPRRVLAGACRDHLLGVRFVDGRGRVLKSGGRVMKNVTGLDLGKLLCGSYGTLGILTEIAIKTLPVAPRQLTIAFHRIDASQSAAIFAKALATPFEVSGAAFQGGTAWLRLEGLDSQVDYRRDRVQALFAGSEMEIIADDESRSLWASLRDAEKFAGSSARLWRVHVKPTDAPAALAWLERLGGEVSIDWGGGLIWCSGPIDRAQMRSAITEGHATLVRRGGLGAADMFQPASGPLGSLTAQLRRTFDPYGILNPGLMRA